MSLDDYDQQRRKPRGPSRSAKNWGASFLSAHIIARPGAVDPASAPRHARSIAHPPAASRARPRPREKLCKTLRVSHSNGNYYDVLNLSGVDQALRRQTTWRSTLLGGTAGNAVWPWPRLDGKLIPDFMLAEANSAGIHWTLVELESPRARMLLPDGRLADKAREGVSQIRAWRDYLADQIAHARAPRHENGLGLVGIRPHRARGIVLIGRREDTIELPTHERLSLANESLILIHSYDWLIDQLGGGTHPGPWAPLNRELRAAGVDLNDIAWN